MIIPNGTIEFRAKPSDAWGDPIACQYLVQGRDRLGARDGVRAEGATYQVLLDAYVNAGAQARLSDFAGAALGVFPVRRSEVWPAVNQVSLWL